MHPKAILISAFLAALVVASPVPGDVNVPITDAEWAALDNGGLKARDGQAAVNQPISDTEWQALSEMGLQRRSNDDGTSLARRDSVLQCGHKVSGKGGSNGHGKWVPVAKFASAAEQFCSAYVGTDIYRDHETSDTYGISLTNEDDDTQPGPAGNIVFAIYNTAHAGTWVVDHDNCLRAMKAPLGNHVSKRDDGEYVRLSKRDNCYGSDHNDYEGGYYEISGIGKFGSEVYAA